MKKMQENNLVSWDDHLDKKYGKSGTPTRNKYEEEFENFKIGVLIQEARKQQNLTQEELARLLKSSQSRIAKMEAGDPSVSLDLLVRSLLVLGTSRKTLSRILA